MISKASIDKIFNTAIIEDVIGDYVRLKKRGSGFVGLSPWSNEKTPSFHVSPSKNIFKDFSSGKGGNVVTFLMEMEGFSYPEALRHLAKRYNIEIEEDENSNEDFEKQQDLKEAIFIANSFARDYFREQLYETEEGKSIGLSYFKERGFNEESIKKFEMGYAPEGWDNLGKTMLKQQFKQDILIKAGLVKEREKGNIDFFRNRVIFTIHNYIGKVVGFGGRALKEGKSIPKYLNTPESEVYNKSKILYGLFQAKQSIRKEDNCFMVEGYTDVVSLAQAGVENVVASAGTALTSEQVRLIKRLSQNITILYDGDAAGIKAALRGLDICLEEDMNAYMVLLPESEDPDSFVKSRGGQAFRDYVAENSEDFIHFKAKHLKKEAGNQPAKRAEAVKELVQSLSLIKDSLKRSIYTKDCALILDIEEELLISAINKLRRSSLRKKLSREEARAEIDVDPEENPQKKKSSQSDLSETQNIHDLLEKNVLRLLVNHSTDEIEEDENVLHFVMATLENHELEFQNPVYKSILNEFKTAFDEEDFLDIKDLVNHEDEGIRNSIVDLLHQPYELSENWEKKHEIYSTDPKTILKKDVINSLQRFLQKKVELMIEELDHEIKEFSGEEEELLTLLKHKKELHKNWSELASGLGTVIVKK